MEIKENIRQIVEKLPSEVTLIAVSKTKPAEYIREAYDGGQRVFGENRPQEMAAKYQILPKDIEWHLIGQLQDKNVKYIAPFVSLIHSVDSLKLLIKIDKEAQKYQRVIDCLLEFHIAKEESKAGLNYEEACGLLENEAYHALKNVRITGVMGIATYTEDKQQIRNEFKNLKDIFSRLKSAYFTGNEAFRAISMGMSDDYLLAVEEGSTLVRVGRAIFGTRDYK